ncbi:MAG: cob(I)yrinic acid a,c-diamide adenosyltransferase [Chrysiogenales bacterium]|nr:MAG: cob(I)yrinic acid a,c-diamide adenosyltransferase [Chrysiogenales bacterium]
MFEKGYVHIYTGNGKGKTTAALGLAFRAAGSGIATLVIQFMKGLPSGERDAAAMTGGLVRVESHGSDRFCRPDDGSFEEHRTLARGALERARRALAGDECAILVLDEIITAAAFRLISDAEILDLVGSRPEGLELVLTGRGASDELIEHADLVTEMREIKHYYNDGVPPRKGIED